MKSGRGILWLACALVLVLGASTASADSVPAPILTVSGTRQASLQATVSSGAADDAAAYGISFVLGRSFSDLTISVPQFITAGEFRGTAWLTDAIGPAATSANVVASSPFDVCAATSCGTPPPAEIRFLSGLSLSPGTYYFILSTPFCSHPGSGCSAELARLLTYSDPMISAASDVAAAGEIASACPASGCANGPLNEDFPPASTWSHMPDNVSSFKIEATVPEPGSLPMVISGLAMVLYFRMKKRPGETGRKRALCR